MKLLREIVEPIERGKSGRDSSIFGFRYRGPSLARIVGTSAIERKIKAGLGISQARRMIGLGKLAAASFRGERATGKNANQARNWLYGKVAWYGRHPSLTVLRQAYHGYKKGGVRGAIKNAIEKPIAIMKAYSNPMGYVRLLKHGFEHATGINKIKSLFGGGQKPQRQRKPREIKPITPISSQTIQTLRNIYGRGSQKPTEISK